MKNSEPADKPKQVEREQSEKPPYEEFLAEPFSCPACGQLLGSSCRVCVACKHVIDPAEIRQETPPVVVEAKPPGTPAKVRFPWRLFFLFFWTLMVVGIALEFLIGPPKTQLVVWSFQLLSAIWVSFDAHAKHLPKPLRWGLAALFPTWLIILPWYLVRRRRPEDSCPFVEAPASPLTRALLLIVLAVLLYVIFKQAPPP